MEEGNDTIKNLLQRYERKPVLIILKNGFTYKTSSLKVIGDSISFTDKYNQDCLIAISEICSVQGIQNEKY